MTNTEPYQAKKFKLSGLKGISDQTLEMHFKLYEGYVKSTNQLTQEISDLIKGGNVDQEEIPMYSELKRRFGFEYNGMVLHEYYFDNLMKNGGGKPRSGSSLISAMEDSFGSFEIWKADFSNVGKMRGVGWAICYQDPLTQKLSNHWTSLHEIGNVAGFVPVLVMDVWEHAFLLDYQPSERGKYIEAFFSNINWTIVEERLGGTLVRAQNV